MNEQLEQVLDYEGIRAKLRGHYADGTFRFATCWITANVWMLVALALHLGCELVKVGSPNEYSFYGEGLSLTQLEYAAIEVLSLLMALACFMLAFWRRR